ncbi:MAG: hypothetical protein ACFFFT_09235 [Candidatus Thorarchaeota archaeon]
MKRKGLYKPTIEDIIEISGIEALESEKILGNSLEWNIGVLSIQGY